MKTQSARQFAIFAAAAALASGLPLLATADEPLDELDAPMTVFDDVASVPTAVSRMPRPATNAAGAAYNDAPLTVAAEADVAIAEEDLLDEDSVAKREIRAEFERDLVEGVREGYRAPQAFEGLDREEERLWIREDHFHIEEGEDVDVEDGFNEEDEAEIVDE